MIHVCVCLFIVKMCNTRCNEHDCYDNAFIIETISLHFGMWWKLINNSIHDGSVGFRSSEEPLSRDEVIEHNLSWTPVKGISLLIDPRV